MNAIVLRGLLWLDDFLKDGTTGGRSSSRLIACGAATIMAVHQREEQGAWITAR